MAGNSFGKIFQLVTFGESHGAAIGGIIDGVPAGLEIQIDKIQEQLSRRRPGQSRLTTSRNEADAVQFLSGLFEGKTLGTPIGFTVANKDSRSSDYSSLKEVYRPSHADYVYDVKYGIRDHRGGGRSSARETVSRVVAGSVAEQILPGVSVVAYVSQVGDIVLDQLITDVDRATVDENSIRCPDMKKAAEMTELVERLKEEGDSVGGRITCLIQGVPAGWGEPVFDKLHADLAKAMMSINAVKGFEIGSGFRSASMKGSEHNDAFTKQFNTTTNYSGGVQGGISNGQPIWFNVAFKPVATIKKAQKTVDSSGSQVILEASGRHDPCVVPRAIPIVESMAALVLADHYLRNKMYGNI